MRFTQVTSRLGLLLVAGLSSAACEPGRAGLAGQTQPGTDAGADVTAGADADTATADAAARSDGPGSPSHASVLFQLVDNMENGQIDVATPIGLASWFGAPADPSVTSSGPGAWGNADLDAPRDASLKAIHARVAGPGAIDSRIDIHGPAFQGGGPPYPDLGRYAGVAFWSRGAIQHGSQAGSIVVAIEDDRVVSGKSYAETRTSGTPWFEHPVELTTEWRRHILLFDDFRQPGGSDGRLHTQAIWSVHFLGGLDGAGAEFWIDDLALLCRGACPSPQWGLAPKRGSGFDDGSLPWFRGEGTSSEATCAAIASLSMAPLSELPADPSERVFLRVRIPIDPAPAVPLWVWKVEDLSSGATIGVTAIDDGWTTIAVPIAQSGSYRVTAHTHYPGSAVCGADVVLQAR